MDKYERNIGTLSPAEQETLSKKHACIVGGGGLGGYIAEMLVRIGVGTITMIDGDTFGENNLNRQLYATLVSMGNSKSVEAAKRARLINPGVDFRSVKSFLTEQNAAELIMESDIVLDALDNMRARLILESACEKLNLLLVHGYASQWQSRVCVVCPGSKTLSKLYSGFVDGPAPSVPSFTPAFTASLEVAEAIKLLLGRQSPTQGKLLDADLLDGTFEYSDI